MDALSLRNDGSRGQVEKDCAQTSVQVASSGSVAGQNLGLAFVSGGATYVLPTLDDDGWLHIYPPPGEGWDTSNTPTLDSGTSAILAGNDYPGGGLVLGYTVADDTWRVQNTMAELQGLAPSNTTPPVVTSADLLTGTTASVSDGTWTNSPTSFAYQWFRDGVPIAGATAASYTFATVDIGANVSASVVATNAEGSSGASLAAAVGPIAAGPLSITIPQVSATTFNIGALVPSTSGTWSVDYGDGTVTNFSDLDDPPAHNYATAFTGDVTVTYNDGAMGATSISFLGDGYRLTTAKVAELANGQEISLLFTGGATGEISGSLADLPMFASGGNLSINSGGNLTGDVAILGNRLTDLGVRVGPLHSISGSSTDLTNLTYIRVESSVALTVDLADLPLLDDTLFITGQSVVNGTTADIPATITSLWIQPLTNNVSGDLGELPDNMLYMRMYGGTIDARSSAVPDVSSIGTGFWFQPDAGGGLDAAEMDAVLADLAGYGRTGAGNLQLIGSNAAPTAVGEAHIDTLRALGWVVGVTGGY